MFGKNSKSEKGPSKPSKVTNDQEQWHTDTSDDEESYVNELDTFDDDDYLNELDDFDEAENYEDEVSDEVNETDEQNNELNNI